jgi:hypothetical protein
MNEKRFRGKEYLDEFTDDGVEFAIRLRSKVKDCLDDATEIIFDITNRYTRVQTTEREIECDGPIGFLPSEPRFGGWAGLPHESTVL